MELILGMGCDRGASLQTLNEAVDQALSTIEYGRDAVIGLASIDKKFDEEGLLELAQRQRWTLTFFSADQLAKVDVPNPSEVVRKYMGTPAVSEAAAILAAETTKEALLVEKFKYLGQDGKNATVSVVRCK